ncbi:uncharacterized protein F5891DRAFT_1147353 [Suillus fuscotomentosus]|uniref:t-SNARE coiled-coil homology domain-containing protein n=1 Tax=Suillus fuscotomentosus TaxID=1912939 RepID=A0AAD4E4N9_9AGAM|nr:uncharacterized protein F5891DRAFT_1147353 [Suillus fuscotomentosus]KAG1881693.1 hypothetical protein C8R48DRAFT_624094 [Suillus tomentosus]KAG1899191.1 hypothetical protein F5891DRAFT_1147353 [Suillus fuscotomentosus]
MSFFKRKEKNLIPPVQSAVSTSDGSRGPSRSTSSLPSYKSTASTYVASRDGPDPYNAMSTRTQSQNSYDNYDTYSATAGKTPDVEGDRNRNELFAGFKPQGKTGSGRYFDGPALGKEPSPGEENDEDVEGIKQQTRFMKQESVNSTRNALRLAREAEETAGNTIGRLGDQSEKLANTERHLDVSKGHTLRAEDQIGELKQLNRSIFRPVITWNKDAKRAAQEDKLQQRYEDERLDREKAMQDIRDTQNRLGRATTYGRQDEESLTSGGSGRFRTEEQLATRKEQRKRYQFEGGASDDEMEDELDDNLNEISAITKNLKALGTAMGQELDQQNSRLVTIEQKTTTLDNNVFRNTERLKRIK